MQPLDYFAPFTYFFKSRDWLRKFVIASLLTYTLVGAAPVLGWMIAIVRRVGQAEEPDVPELSDWKNYWNLGGQFAFVNAVWLLPVAAAVILTYLPVIFNSTSTEEMFVMVWGGTLACVLVFLLVYSIFYTFLVPAMLVVLAGNNSKWQAANPVILWKTARAHFTAYLLVFLIVGLVLFNVMLVLAALTIFLLLPPLLVYTWLVSAHFAGQLARLDRNKTSSVNAGGEKI
jgi:hypothetical protein